MDDTKNLGVKHLQVRLTSEEHAALQRQAGGPGKVQVFLRSAIQDLLHSKPKPAPASQHQPWIDKLVTILEHGTDLDKVGIQSNLDAFCAKITLENLPRRKRAAGE